MKQYGQMKFRGSALALVWLAMASGEARAHHSLQLTHDLKREVKLKGTVIQVLLRNPHSFLQIGVPDKDGRLERVALEFPKGASALGKQGIHRATLRVGDEVTITMNPPLRPTSGLGNLKHLRRESDGFEWSDRKITAR